MEKRPKSTKRRKIRKEGPLDGEAVLEDSTETEEEILTEQPEMEAVESIPTPEQPTPAQSHTPPTRFKRQHFPFDEYTYSVMLDQQSGEFLASCLEFPDLKGSGSEWSAALEEIRTKVEDETTMMQSRGEPLPEPLYTKSYPTKLEIQLSQQLFRKLDQISKMEKVPLDQWVLETLSSIAHRKSENRRSFSNPPQQQPQQHSHFKGGHRNNHRQNRGAGGPPRGKGYHESLERGENFLEYVRNLEKGRGPWKKR